MVACKPNSGCNLRTKSLSTIWTRVDRFGSSMLPELGIWSGNQSRITGSRHGTVRRGKSQSEDGRQTTIALSSRPAAQEGPGV